MRKKRARPGRLRLWGRIERSPEADPDAEDFDEVGLTATTIIARLVVAVYPLSGQERVTAQQQFGHVTHELHTRWQTGVTAGMRFVSDGGRYFNIVAAANDDELNRWLIMLCMETPS